MKLSNFYAVQSLVTKLIDVEGRLKAVTTDGRLTVTIDGRYQDTAAVEVIRPVLQQRIVAEKKGIEQQLSELGVEIDC